MKKRCFILYVLSAAFFCLLFLCSKKQEDVTEKKEEAVADYYSYTIKHFKKNVNWSPDDSIWKTVSLNLKIGKGAWMETGAKSYAALEGTLGDVVILGERSKVRLILEELAQYEKSGTAIVRGMKLLKGLARFSVKKNNSGFIVETPTARVKVKGTRFTVSYNEKKMETDVYVEEGSVEVEDRKKPGKVIKIGENEKAVGIGTGGAKKCPTDSQDKKFLEKEIPLELESLQQTRSIEEEKKIHRRLGKEIEPMRGRETAKEKARSLQALQKEREKSQKTMDSVRVKYAEDKKKEYDGHDKYKKEQIAEIDSAKIDARKVLDEERKKSKQEAESARSSLDAEREKFRKSTSPERRLDTSSSDDAFDELKRRKEK